VNRAVAILAALLVGATALLAAELVVHATRHEVTVADPCRTREPFPGHGLDATVQRVVLDGLDGAACRLHTTREELVLSIGGGSLAPRQWDEHTVEVALRAGLLRSVDAAERRGDVPGFLAPALRGIVEHAPLDKLIRGGFSLSDLLGG
jgi:hypothetical protein